MRYLNCCCYIIFSLTGLLFTSCRKYECPDLPVQVTLSGNEFMDVHISSNSSNGTFNKYSILAAVGWTQAATPFQNRGIFKFDYSKIPAGAKVMRATLTLYADTTVAGLHGHNSDNKTGPNNWVIERITSDWDINTITWNNQPYSDASTQMVLPSSTSYKQTYVIDMTNFVTDEINNPSKAFGYKMRLLNEAPYNSVVFASADNVDNSLHPKLEIEYMEQ